MNKIKINILDPPDILNCLVLALVIIVFNLSSLDVDVIILDDLAHYSEAIEDNFEAIRLRRLLVNPFINHLIVKSMAVSPPLARSIILMAVMIPLSIIVYYFYRQWLLLPKGVAFFAALLPQILPGQAYIPAFIVGSYTTWGLLIFFIVLLFSFKYLSNPKFKYILVVTLFYFVAVETTEIAIFLAFPLFVIIVSFNRFKRKHLILTSTIGIICLYKTLYTIFNPYSNVTAPGILKIDILLDRLQNALVWVFPNPGISKPEWIVVLTIITIGTGLIIAFKKPFDSIERHSGKYEYECCFYGRHRWTWYYLFGITWVAASLVPFVFSKYFSSRYVYVAGFGLNLLIVLGIYNIFHRGILKKFYFSTIVLLTLTVFVGIERNKSVEKTFGPIEFAHSIIKPALNSFDFPKDSQIVITGSLAGYLYTGGYWVWSTGYLKYTTRRKDITGIVGKEKTFYDPFNIKERGYSYTMTGLDLNNPLFLFRVYKNQLIQIYYCLQWKGEDEREEWTIYKIEASKGNVVSFISGAGKSNYENTLTAEGVEHKDVFWGG